MLNDENTQNVADCNCTRQCNSATYTNNKEKVYADVKPDRLRFRVYFNVILLSLYLFNHFV